jgi:ABC-type transport system substrate-binding protein
MSTPTSGAAPAEPFVFTRQTAAFLGLLGALELLVVLVFPLLSLVFAVLALALLIVVWFKAGLRTRKWLWWRPATAPLTQAEGAITVAAAVLVAAGALVTGYEGIRFTSGKTDFLTGYIWWHLRQSAEAPQPPPVRTRGARGTGYSNRDMQQALKDELAKAGIPYTLETRDGTEFVMWTEEHKAAVDGIMRKLHEGPARMRSVSFESPATQEEFKQWLLKRGIAYETSKTGDREYVSWKDGPADLAMQFMRERTVPCEKKAAESSPAADTIRC